MGYILNLHENKLLTLKRGITYIGEDNADNILIILPKTYREYDLLDCSVLLHIIVQDINHQILGGNIVELTLSDSAYEDRYISDFNISKLYTSQPQTIILKIEIIHDDNMIVYSNEVNFPIKPHHITTSAFENNNPDLLVEYLKKVNDIQDNVNQTFNEIFNMLNNPVVITENGDFRLKLERSDDNG